MPKLASAYGAWQWCRRFKPLAVARIPAPGLAHTLAKAYTSARQAIHSVPILHRKELRRRYLRIQPIFLTQDSAQEESH